MGMLETFKTRQAEENQDFYQKDLIGDAVAQCQELADIKSNKDGRQWLVLKCEAIHPIEDPKGRETTIEAGDEISTFYDPGDDDSMKK